MPKSIVRNPQKEAEDIFRKPGYEINLSKMARKTGISRSTLHRYMTTGFESAPLWAVCTIIRYLNMPDEDRLKLLRCYTGELR